MFNRLDVAYYGQVERSSRLKAKFLLMDIGIIEIIGIMDNGYF